MKKKKHTGEAMACGATDRGMVREHNEDNYFIDEDFKLFIVADGVGGHQGGQKASEIAVTILPLLLKEATGTVGSMEQELKQAIDTSVRTLSHKIFEKSMEIDDLRGMGSTLVCCLIRKGKAFVSNMGDSRGYLVREGKIERITEDHSMVQSMVKMGQIDEEQAGKHPLRHVITRYVGMEGNFGPDVFIFDLREGDRILLCSDGLTDMLPEQRIEKMVAEEKNMKALPQKLIDRANDAGGRDNVTVLVIEYNGMGPVAHKPRKHVRSDCKVTIGAGGKKPHSDGC
jgi:PPM family protein phosphatase